MTMPERRYFTVEEANSMVPWLDACFGRILRLRSQMRSLYSTLEDLGHRPDPENLKESLQGNLASGVSDEVQSARAKFVGLMELMQDELVAIQTAGVEIKDLDTGLCDFWSVSILPGEEVYLCWRFGEKRIAFYHPPHAGFAGRKPLPESKGPEGPTGPTDPTPGS
jgi:hypothetical protein